MSHAAVSARTLWTSLRAGCFSGAAWPMHACCRSSRSLVQLLVAVVGFATSLLECAFVAKFVPFSFLEDGCALIKPRNVVEDQDDRLGVCPSVLGSGFVMKSETSVMQEAARDAWLGSSQRTEDHRRCSSSKLLVCDPARVGDSFASLRVPPWNSRTDPEDVRHQGSCIGSGCEMGWPWSTTCKTWRGPVLLWDLVVFGREYA